MSDERKRMPGLDDGASAHEACRKSSRTRAAGGSGGGGGGATSWITYGKTA